MGPWTSLHSLSRTRFGMMPGDTVRMSVYAKYDWPTKTREAISGMAGIIAGAITGGAADVEGIQQISRSIGETLKGGQAALLAKNNNVPKAYLNYIFFDAEMQSKSTNFKQISEAAHGSFEQLEMEFIAQEEGYLVAYTSNQTNEDLNVFMDDMTVTHTTGPIVRVDDYYPFGLTFNSSKLDGKLTNKFLYSGKERQELTGWDDFGARMYMAEIGRWGVIDPLSESYFNYSPYNFAANNPLIFTDPNGAYITIYYEEDGNTKEYRYEYGAEYKGNNSFVANVIAQLDYLIDNSPGETNIIKELAEDEGLNWGIERVSMDDLKKENRTLGDGIVTLGIPGTDYVHTSFNDVIGFKTNMGGLQNPTTTLYHEGGHAYIRLVYYKLAQEYIETNNPKYLVQMEKLVEKMGSKAEGYLNFEEKYVNDKYETPLTRQMGEGIRTSDYGSSTYQTSGPFTTKPKGQIDLALPPGKKSINVMRAVLGKMFGK